MHEAIARAEDLGMTVQITEGLRTLERQRQLVAAGKSKTMNSYHLNGRAVDVYVNNGWKFEDYQRFADIVKTVAKEHGQKITWGGDFRTLKDGPHFQIELSDYTYKVEH
jgi:peptidoglycan L-alanyl-D-glutamate endopeptidase CwlK